LVFCFSIPLFLFSSSLIGLQFPFIIIFFLSFPFFVPAFLPPRFPAVIKLLSPRKKRFIYIGIFFLITLAPIEMHLQGKAL